MFSSELVQLTDRVANQRSVMKLFRRWFPRHDDRVVVKHLSLNVGRRCVRDWSHIIKHHAMKIFISPH